MTLAQAHALSAALTEACISHTVHVGYHQDMAQQIQCRVDVPLPRRYSGGLAAAMKKLEEIGEPHGAILGTSIMGSHDNVLTYSTEEPVVWPVLHPDAPR